jgi:pyridoxamine 5'-phosphate oxidase
LSSRGELEEALARAEASFEGRSVPRPAYWGGFSLEPTAVEFFQQREDRLHDRVIYERSATGWSRTRLSP